ncbi:histidine ABC transporter, permease protein HisM [Vibrio sp. JCM 18904]|nr:histidine ABC transporter, permease protein HisM [Vibrio sp. JCM 18904]
MDFSLIIESFPTYLQGLWTTVWLVGLALVIGLCVSIPLAWHAIVPITL